MARVQILPEKSLSPMQPWLSSWQIHQRASLLDGAVQEQSWTRYRSSLDTKTSRLPGWVIQQFDCHSLAARVRQQIKKLMAIDDSSMELVPTEAHSLSFWAANNLLIDDEGRLKLLEQDNVIYRLRTVLELINKVSCKQNFYQILTPFSFLNSVIRSPVASAVPELRITPMLFSFVVKERTYFLTTRGPAKCAKL